MFPPEHNFDSCLPNLIVFAAKCFSPTLLFMLRHFCYNIFQKYFEEGAFWAVHFQDYKGQQFIFYISDYYFSVASEILWKPCWF